LSLEKRRVNITFLSEDSVIITNALWQKTFILKESTVIDLKTLKKIKVENIGELSVKGKVDSPFFVCFTAAKKEYSGMVVLKPGKDKIELLQNQNDIVCMKNNNKDYSATVYVND
jgi:hypothetical protein